MENRKRYDIDVEREVFSDQADYVAMLYIKYAFEKGIQEDKNNPFMLKYDEVVKLERNAYKMNSYEEIDEAYKKLEEMREYYNECRNQL